MPFRGPNNGAKQRRWMWANRPDIARRWTNEEKRMANRSAHRRQTRRTTTRNARRR